MQPDMREVSLGAFNPHVTALAELGFVRRNRDAVFCNGGDLLQKGSKNAVFRGCGIVIYF